MKVVSFSLWGEDAQYTIGAIRNAELMEEIYPSWTARFYVGTSTPDWVIAELQELKAEIVAKNEPGDWFGMLWRFEAAADPAVTAMISRDCDSRINYREKFAVEEWMRSDKVFHIMRDHPQHYVAIPGGMWGAKAGAVPHLMTLLNEWQEASVWQTDQWFLRKRVFPLIFKKAMVHDEFFEKRPFPFPRVNGAYVGEAYDEKEQFDPELRKALNFPNDWKVDRVIANRWVISRHNRWKSLQNRLKKWLN